MKQDLEKIVAEKLRAFFGDVVELDFHDEKGDGRHFYLEITSDKFIGKSRVEQSQLVYTVLDEYIKTGYIHALRMKCRIPTS